MSYADIILVSLLQMVKRIDEKKFERFIAIDPALPKIFEASKEWLKKED